MKFKSRLDGYGMLFAGCAALFGVIATSSFAADSNRPNIIFILTDDLGYGDLGVLFQNSRALKNARNEPWHHTPQLDRLASEGIQLRHHYCPAPVCAPSRASLLLGVHQGHAGIRNNQFDKALENNHTIATVLKHAGYATACIGKWGLQGSGSSPSSWPGYPARRGFDYFFGYVRHSDGHEHYPKEGLYRGAKQVWDMNAEISATLDKCYTTDLFTARAKKWIGDQRAADPSQPFFLYLAFDTPHAVQELPTQAYPAGGGVNGGIQWLGIPGQMINTASGAIDSFYHPDYAGATYDHDDDPDTVEVAWPNVYKRFATSIRRIDDCVGDILQLLADLGIDSNTLIVFSSDNGPTIESYLSQSLRADFFNSFGPFDGIKRDLWEGGIRMPSLARWPGRIPAGRISTLPSQFHDWLPTFAEMAGVPAPARSDGVSLLPDLLGVHGQRTPTVYVEYFSNSSTPGYAEFLPAHRGRSRNQMQAIRFGDLLGVRYNITSHADDFEIYNVVADPQQGTNLAVNSAYAAVQAQMKQSVLRLRRPNDTASRPYDNELVPPINASPVIQGIEWRAYTNAFPWVAELTILHPSETGTTGAPTLDVRPRDDDVALLFTGYIAAPADGDYTFHLTADTGALLRIHAATVIDADFGYEGGAEISGTIKLKAGRHPFRLYYARGTNSSPLLQLEWTAPGKPREAVPATAFFRDGTGAGIAPTAVDDFASTTQGVPVLVDVLANDMDDGLPQALSIQSVAAPFGGTTDILGNQVLYTPAPHFLGTDMFNYHITDGSNSASATVSVNVLFFDTNAIWLPFNQTSGFTADDAGGRTIGLLSGFADTSSHWVEGRFNRGLLFNGASTVVTLDSSLYRPPSGTSARTTAAWIKADGANTGAIVAWGPNSTSRKWMMRLDTGTGRLRVEIGGGYVIASADLRDGKWHHVAGVLPEIANPNATNIALYVDGVRQVPAEIAASPINTDAATATVGKDSQNRYFDGILDEVRIYRRALSDAEIAALASATHESAAAWHRRHFGDAAVDWGSDDDGDGGSRLLEYAMGGHPHIRDASEMAIQAEINNGHLQIGFNRLLPGINELEYTLEGSTDFANWASLNAMHAGSEPGPSGDVEKVFYRINSAPLEWTRIFVRLKVTLR